MGRNPIDSEVVARVYVDFSAIVTLLLGGALACYGEHLLLLVLCLKMKKVRSERASSEMRKAWQLFLFYVLLQVLWLLFLLIYPCFMTRIMSMLTVSIPLFC
ncbi:hypothetical protein CsSME_00028563 [Camellia sinensis var. sinensis]